MTTEYAVDTADTAFAVAVARAWQDERFLADLTRDPAAVMASLGYEAPVGLTMDVLVDTPQVNHLVLAQSTRDEDTSALLEQIAHGFPPGGAELRVVQNTETHRHLVIPLKPEGLDDQIDVELKLATVGKVDEPDWLVGPVEVAVAVLAVAVTVVT